jgi:thiamine biosynthesis lipoprotein
MTDERTDTFACFGGLCSVHVTGAAGARSAEEALRAARAQLLDWHARFSRFEPDSELSRLNSDPRTRVPVSPTMARLAAAVCDAGERTGGLVDGTLVAELLAAGYASDIEPGLALGDALAIAPARRSAGCSPLAAWRTLRLDPTRSTLTRAPGVRLDSGGLAKGLFADALARDLSEHAAFAVNCAGDLACGGRERATRPIHVESPFDGSVLHTFQLRAGAAATSGIGRRAWLDARGRPCHHLLDPATGRPAFTGIVQATALADTALEAEIRAKAALLSGPAGAPRWLAGGGVIVLDDGSHHVAEPIRAIALTDLSAHLQPAASAVAEAV